MDALAVIAEPTRRRILQLVWQQELAAGDIAAKFPVTFSAVSQHLAVLRGAGLVEERRQGRKRLYRADLEKLGPLKDMLERMWAEQLGALKSLAEVEQRSIGREHGRRTHDPHG